MTAIFVIAYLFYATNVPLWVWAVWVGGTIIEALAKLLHEASK